MINPEPHRVAARLAASPWFPLPGSETRDGRPVRDSIGHVEVEGNTLRVTVTDHDGAVREYVATVQLVAEKDAPGRCANTAEGDSNHPTTKKEKF